MTALGLSPLPILGSASPSASCWGYQGPAVNGGSSVSENAWQFCTSITQSFILPSQPLRGHWSIGAYTVEVVATVDTNHGSCRNTSFNLTNTDLLCFSYLTQILDQCGIGNAEGDLHGSLSAENCTRWSLRKCLYFFLTSFTLAKRDQSFLTGASLRLLYLTYRTHTEICSPWL